MATSAYYGNPNIQRQGEKARQIAQQRNVSDIADPRTYGFMQGLFGTAPDQLGYSVFDDPATKQAAQQAAEVGFVGGGLLSSLPIVGPALRGYGRLAAGQVNRAMMGEGGLFGPITPQPMYVVPPGKGVKPINLSKGIYKPDLTMEEMLKVRDIPTVDRVRQSIDLIGEKEFEKMVNAKYSQYKPSNPDQEAMLVESVTLDVLGRAQRSPYPQQAALDLAQQRAALPISEGGLGLPVGNTPMDRAKAMGYPMGKGFDVSYEMGNSPIAFTNTLSKPTSPRKKAEIIKAELEQMGIPVVGETAGTGSTYLKIPGNPYDISSKYGGGQAVPIETLRFSTHSKREFGKPTNTPDVDSYLADVFPKGGNTLEDARKAIDDLIKQGGMRSRFAAFDPFRRNAAIATAMGVALPDLLAQPVNQYQPTYETIPTYTDPFGNTIGSSIR